MTHQRHILFFPTPITPIPPIAADPAYTYPTTPRGPCTPTRRGIFSNPLCRPHRLISCATYTLRTAYPRGDSATLRSPGNRLLWLCLGEGSRRTLGHPVGTPQRVTRRNTQNSCGDTNGSTLHVAKQVRGIQNPQSCRQTHWISRFPSAPLLHLNRPDTLVFRLPTQLAGESLILARAIIYFRD